MKTSAAVFALVAASSLPGCGDRPALWDQPAARPLVAHGLSGSIALVDDPAHRVVMLTAGSNQMLATTPLPVGHTVVRTAVSRDGEKLFVLSSGDYPRRKATDEVPSLTIIGGGTAPSVAYRFELSDVLTGLATDPLGRWAAVYAGAGQGTAFVENPNELILIDLQAPPGGSNPVSRTLRSFGGRPQRLTFTQPLALPKGERRLLVVETDQDVSILDLDHLNDTPERPEITVRLTSGADSRKLEPAGIAVTPGDASKSEWARIGIRTKNDTNVITLALGPVDPAKTPPPPNDFAVVVNLTDVGGAPSDIAFVRTDGGLRLAALVPASSSAVLVDPETSVTSKVELPSSYQSLSLVTDVVSEAPDAGVDVALLWKGGGYADDGVALWALGKTTGKPYRSVEVLPLSASVSSVIDVPAPHGELKILETSGAFGFYVLDLKARTVAPLETSSSSVSVNVSPNGERAWAYVAGTTSLASVDLATLHPRPLLLDRQAQTAFEIARDDGGRAIVALHATGAVGATVFDARQPDDAAARLYSGLLLGGL